MVSPAIGVFVVPGDRRRGLGRRRPEDVLLAVALDEAGERAGVHLVARRRELDRLYPVTAASEQPTTPAAQPAHDDVQPTPQRRKPGRKITQGWRLFAAHAAYEFKEEHGRVPSGPELAQICDYELGYQPDTSDIAKLFRYLLGD